MSEKTQAITITIYMSDKRIERYKWALNELPYKTSEDWEIHLGYELQNIIDATIEEAAKYREWRGLPSVPNLLRLERQLSACKTMTDFDDLYKAIETIQQQYTALLLRCHNNTHPLTPGE